MMNEISVVRKKFPIITFKDFEENNSDYYYDTFAITPFKKWLTLEEMEVHIDPIIKELNNGIFSEKPMTFLCFYLKLYSKHSIYVVKMKNYKNKEFNNNFSIVKISNEEEFVNICKDSISGHRLMRLIIPELSLLIESMFDLTDLLHFLKDTPKSKLLLVKKYFDECGLKSLEWGKNHMIL